MGSYIFEEDRNRKTQCNVMTPELFHLLIGFGACLQHAGVHISDTHSESQEEKGVQCLSEGIISREGAKSDDCQ